MEDNGIMFDWFYFSQSFPGKGKPGYDSVVAKFMHLIDKGKANTTPVTTRVPWDTPSTRLSTDPPSGASNPFHKNPQPQTKTKPLTKRHLPV